MQRLSSRSTILLTLAGSAGLCVFISAREREAPSAQMTVHAGREGCQVELDAQAVGKTDSHGTLVLLEVEPGDHYLHIGCPGEAESGYFVSPRAGEKVELQQAKDETASSLSLPDARVQRQRLVQQAVQLRAQGRLDEAVARIREALKLDPENSDLHRELGITFLLGKEWKRARVEMLEAIRHDPSDADAHNGLGYALEKLGDLEGALKEYRMATRLDPDDRTYRTHYFDALSRLASQKPKKN